MNKNQNKLNNLAYHILQHHINHFQQIKKILKIDYETHMIFLTVCTHILYQIINPSLIEKGSELDWNEMFPITKNLLKIKKKHKKKLTIFSVSLILDLPKESVRRKVIKLCKLRYLEFSTEHGLSLGAFAEEKLKMMAPRDFRALSKVIEAVDIAGGIKFLKKVK